jgi:N-acetylmuramoyl-L-alanine amidase
MVIRTCALLLAALLAADSSAAEPARSMYSAVLAREEAVRPALAADTASLSTLKDARAVVAAYEAIVRHHPASGYSDNALWQAGRLALDAFARFGQTQDRDHGVRLLRKLAVGYPTSRFARLVSDEVARAGADAGTPLTSSPKDPVLSTAKEPDPSGSKGPAPAPPARLATIRNIRRIVLPDTVRITIELDVEVPFHDERINDPARVFLDLPATRAAAPLQDQTIRFDGDGDIVHQVRLGRQPNSTTRVVLDAAGVSSYSVYPLYGPFRLVIDCVRAQTTVAPAAPAPAPGLSARRLANDWGRRLPSMSPRASAMIRDARVERPVAPVARTSTTPPPAIAAEPTVPPASTAAPLKPLTGGFSMARQLGLNVSRIVIDPGHGGHDPGAMGKGVTESEVVLDVALRLEKLLTAGPGVEVILTRRTDDFIVLQERTAIANREGADLFLSIHANASSSATARGIETYFLNFATTLSAAGVAARENAASGEAMGALPDFVKAIALNNKLDESRDFATQVQRAMIQKLRPQNKVIRDLGVKQAPFVVLIGAAMPSVLAEISFVTNPQEVRLLKSNAYRQKIAEALYGAVRQYQTSLKNVSSVAPQ